MTRLLRHERKPVTRPPSIPRSAIYGIALWSNRPVEPGDADDQRLGQWIDRTEEVALHRAAQRLRGMAKAGFPHILEPGFLRSADEIDPYTEIIAVDPEIDDYNPGENADCAQCRAGEKHWHRKDGNKPVTWLTEEESK